MQCVKWRCVTPLYMCDIFCYITVNSKNFINMYITFHHDFTAYYRLPLAFSVVGLNCVTTRADTWICDWLRPNIRALAAKRAHYAKGTNMAEVRRKTGEKLSILNRYCFIVYLEFLTYMISIK